MARGDVRSCANTSSWRQKRWRNHIHTWVMWLQSLEQLLTRSTNLDNHPLYYLCCVCQYTGSCLSLTSSPFLHDTFFICSCRITFKRSIRRFHHMLLRINGDVVWIFVNAKIHQHILMWGGGGVKDLKCYTTWTGVSVPVAWRRSVVLLLWIKQSFLLQGLWTVDMIWE